MTKILGKLVRDAICSMVNINGAEKTVFNNCVAVRNSNSKGESTFYDITAWDEVARLIEKHFDKGDEILLTGEMRNRTIFSESKERTIMYFLVEKVEFVNGKKWRGDISNTGKTNTLERQGSKGYFIPPIDDQPEDEDS